MAEDDRIMPTSLQEEMQRSYLEYAMSVIVGRALPDARDGLKPVQRRILYAMQELGLTPDRPYRKCARVVGDVLGKYHPHGDQAVYEALVRLVQDFSCRSPLLDGHGNFGSVDDDPPAAMRYTEVRLAPISNSCLLGEIGDDTVDFIANFDDSQQEPCVLPAQLPFLLLNGCNGIAVGMATSIPPHNLGEVVDALVALIRNPELSDARLLKLIPGPDFPTGAEVLRGSGLTDTYLQGRGSIPVRGVAHTEEVLRGKGKHRRNAVVVTELPYQLSKAGWIEKVAELVNDGRLPGISDIRDESDREGMRVVIELRRDADAQTVIEELRRRTPLQSNFGAILLALVNGRPVQLSLRRMLQEFLQFRELTAIRRYRSALGRTEERLEVVEGLIHALDALGEVIEMIRSARDAAAARASLEVRLGLSERQAEAVLAMPLRRLTGLEQEGLRRELEELSEEQGRLRHLLNHREALLDALVAGLKRLKKRFCTPRRTKLIEGGDALLATRGASRPSTETQLRQAYEHLPADSRLLLQSDGILRVLSPQALGRLRLEQACAGAEAAAPARLILGVAGRPSLLAFTIEGRVALLRWELAAGQARKAECYLPGSMLKEKETIVDVLHLDLDPEVIGIGLLSSDGRFKRLAIGDFQDLSGRATCVLKLKQGIRIQRALTCRKDSSVVVATSTGRLLRLPLNDEQLPEMGRTALGPQLMRLLPGETIVGTACVKPGETLLLATAEGQLKRLEVDELRYGERGMLGQIGLRFARRGDRLVDLQPGNTALVGVTLADGRSARLEAGWLDPEDCGGAGRTDLLPAGCRITALVPLGPAERDTARNDAHRNAGLKSR